jgi:hypothetical protein
VFSQPVNGCASIAVVDPGSTTAPPEGQGFAHTIGLPGSPTTISVFTYDKGGSVFNRPFTIAVFC